MNESAGRTRREYCVRFLETPSSKLDVVMGFRLNRANGESRKCTVEEIVDKERRPLGLMYTESLIAESIDSAIGAARSDVNFISSLIAFASGVAVSEPRAHIAFTNDTATNHHFKQIDEVKDFPFSTGNAKSQLIEGMIRRLEDIEDEAVKERLIVSIQMFRKAQSIEDDPLLMFILIWVSLELVDYALIRKLKPPALEKCPTCGGVRGSQLNRGLTEFLKKFDPGRLSDLGEATEIRNSILHRTRDFAHERNRAGSKVPFLVDLFIDCLEHVLEAHLSEGIPRKFIPRVATYFEVSEELMLPEAGAFIRGGSAEIPHVDIVRHPDEVLGPDENVKMRTTTTFTEVGFPKSIEGYPKRNTRILCIGCRPEDIRLI